MSKYHNTLPVVLLVLAAACSAGGAPESAPVAPRPAPVPVADRPVAPVQDAAPMAVTEAPAPQVKGSTVAAAVSAWLEHDGAGRERTDYATERLDLNGDGRDDALVLLRSRRYCSAMGCMLLVFENLDGAYHLTSAFRLGRTPLVAADSRSEGWRDLVAPMTIASSGMRLVMIRHTGRGYATDARHMKEVPPTRDVAGKVLFSDD